MKKYLITLLMFCCIQVHEPSGYDTQQPYVGVLAQELQKIAPYMVNTFTKDKTEYLSVDNTAMTYMLINAVKEQQQQIETQQKQIDELKNLVNQLLKK
jgi:trimeric autotransporter adhesin